MSVVNYSSSLIPVTPSYCSTLDGTPEAWLVMENKDPCDFVLHHSHPHLCKLEPYTRTPREIFNVLDRIIKCSESIPTTMGQVIRSCPPDLTRDFNSLTPSSLTSEQQVSLLTRLKAEKEADEAIVMLWRNNLFNHNVGNN